MIAVFLAAVIAQPLDATIHTGVTSIAMSYPSTWSIKQGKNQNIVANVANPEGDGAAAIEVHTEGFTFAGGGGNAAIDRSELHREALIDKGLWQRYMPPNVTRQNAYERTILGGRACVAVEYVAPDEPIPFGIMAFFFSERRLIVVRMGTRGLDAERRFAELRPLFVSMLDSMQTSIPPKRADWGAIALGAVLVAVFGIGAYVLVHRREKNLGKKRRATSSKGFR